MRIIHRWSVMSILLMIFLIGAGCSDQAEENKESAKTSEQEEKKEEKDSKVPPISDNKWGPEERSFLRYPGTYAGENYDKLKVEEELDQVPHTWDERQYMEKLLSLLAEDYRPYIKRFNELSTDIKVDMEGIGQNIQLPEEKKVHFSILLDASGSMNEKIDGKTKMEIAKEAVQTFASGLPKNAVISLRVYGNKGSESSSDKSVSCNSTEEIYRSTGYNKGAFTSALKRVEPAGWTPIAKALESVQQDTKSETTESYVYVVSDGKETCDGNPVQAAKDLSQSNIKTAVNIIGFDVDHAGQRALQQVANAGNGEYISVDDEKALKQYLGDEYDKLIDEWKQWIQSEVDSTKSQETMIKRTADDIRDEMIDLRNRESDHLKEARRYLQKRFQNEDVYHSDHPIRQINDRINDRRREVYEYANGRYREIRDQANKNARRQRSDVREKGNDAIRDVREEKYNN